MNNPTPRRPRAAYGFVKALLQSIDPTTITASEFAKQHNLPRMSVYSAARALGIKLKNGNTKAAK